MHHDSCSRLHISTPLLLLLTTPLVFLQLSLVCFSIPPPLLKAIVLFKASAILFCKKHFKILNCGKTPMVNYFATCSHELKSKSEVPASRAEVFSDTFIIVVPSKQDICKYCQGNSTDVESPLELHSNSSCNATYWISKKTKTSVQTQCNFVLLTTSVSFLRHVVKVVLNCCQTSICVSLTLVVSAFKYAGVNYFAAK